MKQTPLKRKPYKWKRTPFKQKPKTPKSSKGLFDYLKSEKKGLFPSKESKVEEWNAIREELKERFLRVGITSCELQLKNCTKAANFGFTWSFAHSLKRGAIAAVKDEKEHARLMREVVYACGTCHYAIEQIGNKDKEDGSPTMCDIVRTIIAERKVQP